MLKKMIFLLFLVGLFVGPAASQDTWRLYLKSIAVKEKKATGESWDIGRGKGTNPDVRVILYRYEAGKWKKCFQSQEFKDTFTVDTLMDTRLDTKSGEQYKVEVIDKDLGRDDNIGTYFLIVPAIVEAEKDIEVHFGSVTSMVYHFSRYKSAQDHQHALEEKEKSLEEKEKELEEKEKALEEKEQGQAEKQKALEEKEAQFEQGQAEKQKALEEKEAQFEQSFKEKEEKWLAECENQKRSIQTKEQELSSKEEELDLLKKNLEEKEKALENSNLKTDQQLVAKQKELDESKKRLLEQQKRYAQERSQQLKSFQNLYAKQREQTESMARRQEAVLKQLNAEKQKYIALYQEQLAAYKKLKRHNEELERNISILLNKEKKYLADIQSLNDRLAQAKGPSDSPKTPTLEPPQKIDEKLAKKHRTVERAIAEVRTAVYHELHEVPYVGKFLDVYGKIMEVLVP